MKNFNLLFSSLKKRFFLFGIISAFFIITLYYWIMSLTNHNNIESKQFFVVSLPFFILFLIVAVFFFYKKFYKKNHQGKNNKVVFFVKNLFNKIKWQKRNTIFSSPLLLFLSPFYFARYLEKKNFIFMNSLVCGLEIFSSQKKQNIFEQKTIAASEKITEKLIKENNEKKLYPYFLYKKFINSIFVFSLLLFCGLFFLKNGRALFYGSSNYVKDFFLNTPAIEVSPKNIKVNFKSNLEVSATVLRGNQLVTITYWKLDDKKQKIVMNKKSDNKSVYSFENLEEDIFYTVENSIFKSKVFKVSVVNLPKIEKFLIKVIPPAYTKENNRIYNSILDVDVLSQSEIIINLTANKKNIDSFLFYDNSKKTMKKNNEIFFSYQKKIKEKANTSTPLKIKMTDANKDSFISDEFFINVVEDELPVITIKKPNRDLVIKEKKTIEIEAYLEDDYGIKEIFFVYLKDNKKKEINLLKGKKENYLKTTTVKYSFDFSEKQVEKFSQENSIISYYFKANDYGNEKQKYSRSKIFFIQFKQENKKKKQQQKMPPSNATNQFKSFMRLTDVVLRWKKNMQSINDSFQENKLRRELKKNISSIDIEVKRRFNEAKGDYFVNFFPQLKKGVLGTYEQSIASISNYLVNFNQGGFSEQFFGASQTLSQLNESDILLQQLFPANGSAQSTNQNEQQDDNGQSQNLEQAQKKIEEMIEQQTKINQGLQQGQSNSDKIQKQQEKFSQLKKDLEKKITDNNLQKQLENTQKKLSDLQNKSEFQNIDSQTKSQLGGQALKELTKTKNQIEQLSKKQKLDKKSLAKKLLNDFKKIENSQNKLFRQTKKLSFKNRKALAKQQSQNNNRLFQWTDNLSKAILSLDDKKYDEILKDLKRIKRKVGKEVISSRMKKNQKYLQFNRKQQSLKEQKKILEKLSFLRQQVENMASKRPKLDIQELLAIKKKLQENMSENISKSIYGNKAEGSNSRQKTESLYNQMGNLTGLSQKIDNLYANLQDKKKQNKKVSLEEQNSVLQKTIKEINSLILQQKINQKQFSGETILIPKEYKKIIKDYLNTLK